MAQITWTLRRESDGVTRALASWGIARAKRRLVNMGEDTVLLELLPDLIASPAFSTGETLTLLADGSPWFVGRVKPQAYSASGRRERSVVTLAGPWWHLEHIIYEQARRFVTDISTLPTLPYATTHLGQPVTLTAEQTAANAAALAEINNYPSAVQMTSLVIANEDDAGARIDTAEMISMVLEYAIAKGAPLQIGTLPVGFTVPREELRDVTCAGIITRSLRWTPDVTAAFDYATDPPTLNFVSHSDKDVVTFDHDTDGLTDVDLVAAEDLLTPGVAVCWIKRNTRPGFEFYTQTRDEAGNSAAIGALVVTLELQGGKLLAPDGSIYSDGEPVPEGLAARIYAAFGTLYYRGSFSLKAADCHAASLLSKAIAVTGANPAWANMRGNVQGQTDDTWSGETVIELGPPARLGPADLLELLRASSGLKPVSETDSIARTGGGSLNPDIGSPATPRFPNRDGEPEDGGQVHAIGDYITGTQLVYSLSNRHDEYNQFGGLDTGYPPGAPGFDVGYRQPLGPLPNAEDTASTTGQNPYASYDQNSFVSGAGSYPQRYYSGKTVSNRAYNYSIIDLRSLARASYRAAVLSGTSSKTNQDGTTTYQAVTVDVTASLGGKLEFTPALPTGASYHSGDGFWPAPGYAQAGSVVFNSLILYPRTTAA